MGMTKKLLSIGETAELLGVSIQTLRLWDKKNILNSFRPSDSGKRFYRREDIEKFLKKPSDKKERNLRQEAIEWATSPEQTIINPDQFCDTNDVFSARLQGLSSILEKDEELKNIFPLIIAAAGEIGNNSYNHNIGNWPDVRGIYFGYDLSKKEIILADRGRGILKTLQRVRPQLKNDSEALEVAFTEYISARAPEDRGNGLKFVRDVITNNPLKLQFFTGKATLSIQQNSRVLNINDTGTSFHGCIAIINY